MRNITEKELKEIADKYGYDQIMLVARRGGTVSGPDDANCYVSTGVEKAPWWLSKIRKEIFKHF